MRGALLSGCDEIKKRKRTAGRQRRGQKNQCSDHIQPSLTRHLHHYTTLPSHDESEEEEERSEMKNRTWVSQGGQAHETVINAHISDMYRTCRGFKNKIINFCKNTRKLISIKLIFIVANEVVFISSFGALCEKYSFLLQESGINLQKLG
jgi:hypothetical protein